MQGYLIPVGGVPGTGKSSVSKALAKELDCIFLESSEIAIRSYSVRKDYTERDTLLVEKIDGVISFVKDMLKKKCVILASTYLTELYDELETDIPFIVILRTDPRTLLERLSKRNWPRAKVLENVIAEALDSIYNHASDQFLKDVVEIDTTSKEVSDVVNEIFLKIYRNDFGPKISWLNDEEVVVLVSKLIEELDSYEYGLPK